VPQAQGNFVWLPTGAETLAITEQFTAAGLVVRPFAETASESPSASRSLWRRS